jgi:hypothetical protein
MCLKRNALIMKKTIKIYLVFFIEFIKIMWLDLIATIAAKYLNCFHFVICGAFFVSHLSQILRIITVL